MTYQQDLGHLCFKCIFSEQTFKKSMKALKWSFFKWLISSSAFPLYQISGSFKAEAQTTFLSQKNLSFLFFFFFNLKFQLQLLDLGNPWNLHTKYLPDDFEFLTKTQKRKLDLKMKIISTYIVQLSFTQNSHQLQCKLIFAICITSEDNFINTFYGL